MARRFGGKYSPDSLAPRAGAGAGERPTQSATHQFDGKRVSQVGARSNLMFAAAVLLLLPMLSGTAPGFVLAILGFAIMLASAWMTRQGLIAEDAYRSRSLARRPAIPRKIFGSVLAGLALTTSAFASHTAPLYPLLFGLIGASLHFGAFGADPLGDKGMEGIDRFQTDRVARAVEEAEKTLAQMHDAVLRARDRQMLDRVDGFAGAARQLFRTVENDPRDLTAARKYLSVYLTGARDAAIKFADLYSQRRDPAVRKEFETLLADLETTFASRTQTLLSDNRADLDVEIAVLRDRLKLET
jgi:hypothetical protein